MEESVFHQAFIPRQLHDVADFERAHDRIVAGGAGAHGIYYETISGMVAKQPQADSAAQCLDRRSQQAAKDTIRDSSSSESSTGSTLAAVLQNQRTCADELEGHSATESHSEQASLERPDAQLEQSAAAGSLTDDGDQHGVSSQSENSCSDGGSVDRIPATVSKEDRKSHKKAVNEAARERMKTKMPKHVKKRATKHK